MTERRFFGKTRLRGLVFGALLSLEAAAAGPSPGLSASASCERKAAKGRVVCDVDIETGVPGARIAWADVVVVEAPLFAPPLRTRVGMGDARGKTDRRVRIPVALLASREGKGKVLVRARGVLCRAAERGSETCVPEVHEVAAELVVGADVER